MTSATALSREQKTHSQPWIYLFISCFQAQISLWVTDLWELTESFKRLKKSTSIILPAFQQTHQFQRAVWWLPAPSQCTPQSRSSPSLRWWCEWLGQHGPGWRPRFCPECPRPPLAGQSHTCSHLPGCGFLELRFKNTAHLISLCLILIWPNGSVLKNWYLLLSRLQNKSPSVILSHNSKNLCDIYL